MEESGFGPRWGLDFDQMHGVWVSDMRFPGSYGRIAFRETKTSYWISWNKARKDASIKLQTAASCVEVEHLKMLPVEPDPWFVRCSHCGTYGLPLGYTNGNLVQT